MYIISGDLHILLLEVSGMQISIKFHIREVREQHKMSIRQLAELSGVSKSHISEIENGTSVPTIYTLCVLAVALETRPENLYSYEML